MWLECELDQPNRPLCFYFKSIYFDQPLSAQSPEHNHTDLPDWVTGELRDDTEDSLAAALLKDKISSTPIVGHHRYCSSPAGHVYELSNISVS